MDFRTFLRDVPDFPEPGQTFWDLAPMMADAKAFRAALEAMAEPLRLLEPTHVLGLESRGFIFASALAQMLGLGFVVARRPGRLPRPCFEAAIGSGPEGRLEIQQDAFRSGDRVVIVDDVLATGATAAAARELILRAGAQPLALSTFVELGHLPGRDKLAGMPVRSVLRV